MEILEIVELVLGFFLLFITFIDFFHTTLSGNGFWYISGTLNEYLSRIILSNKNRRFFDYSGLIHLLLTTLCWLILLVAGNLLLFLSDEQMVINAQTKLPADLLERFYYTCYLLSTLGIGDFTPGNDFSRILSSIMSFSGFILLTTALTYLLSVVNSVLSKRQLALTISTLGENIQDLYNFFELEKSSALTDKSGDLRQLILKNASNFLAFPIMNHFMTRKKSRSAEVQLATLYEVLMVLQTEHEEKTVEYAKMEKLINAIELYTSMGLSEEEDFKHDQNHLTELRQFWTRNGKKYQQDSKKDRMINASLKSAGWEWDDVFNIGDDED